MTSRVQSCLACAILRRMTSTPAAMSLTASLALRGGPERWRILVRRKEGEFNLGAEPST